MSIVKPTALSELLTLEASWHSGFVEEAASLENRGDSPLPFLASIRNQLVFVHKNQVDRGSWFERFFLGEPEGQNFIKTLTKVRTLFSQLPTVAPSEEEQKKLYQLELSLNKLGRHVFTRKESTIVSLFDSYSFSDFQVNYKTLPESLPLPCTTTRVLNNTTGEICWLNSFLKYICLSPLYDTFLATSNTDQEKEELRIRLYRIITALRLGWQQPVINALQKELLSFLRRAPSFSRFLDGQQDSFEFANLLRTPELLPTGEKISRATMFTSFANDVMKPGFEHQEASCLEIASTEEATIDLQIAFSRENITENVKEYFVKKRGFWTNATVEDGPKIFSKQDICLHLPECFEVFLQRGFKQVPEKTTISKQLIEITPEGTVTFLHSSPRYDLVNDELFLSDTVITSIHTYKVIAAIERFGRNERKGHFVTHLRNEDGSIATHNDALIREGKTESIWKTASLLTLKRITSELIQNEVSHDNN